jgi:ribose-phosphate pyrophosphokinase
VIELKSVAWLESSLLTSDLEIFTFPGGEPHVRAVGEEDPDVVVQIAVVTKPTMEDLFSLALWADLARSRGEHVWVFMPYLPFARADRGAPLGAAIFADFMNDIVRPSKLIALDPHSQVIQDYLNNLLLLSLPDIVKDSIHGREYVGVIAPDKGARGRALSVAEALGVPVFEAGKTRDFATGKLSGFTCEALPKEGQLLLVDDICDGGGTFIGLAEELAQSQDVVFNRLDLWVSHGIFSKGIDALTDHFNTIYTTNSWTTLQSTSYLKITDLNQYAFGAL